MFENNGFDLKLFRYFSGCGGGVGKSDNIANSVQLLLQLPTGTELGKNNIKLVELFYMR